MKNTNKRSNISKRKGRTNQNRKGKATQTGRKAKLAGGWVIRREL
jgi:hypothetical protein